MSKTWLILDCNYLCHRAFHVIPGLSYGDVKTSVVYGVIRDILYLQDLHNTNRLVFCFDSKVSLRKKVYPQYKANRKENLDVDQKKTVGELYQQIIALRKDYLPALGYQNVFQAKGYEADDLIASVCQNLPKGDKAIVVSSDHDLYQLLNDRVIIWNPGKKHAVTQESFTAEYGVPPMNWPYVKAIAGCQTDNIQGVEGVGELTAAKYVQGKVKVGTKTYSKIVQGTGRAQGNMELVLLPYPGTPRFKLKKDQYTVKKLEALSDRLGLQSIKGGL